MIIADEDSASTYGRVPRPFYKSDFTRNSAVVRSSSNVERVRYTTIQNWSNNVYNLVTKAGRA